MLATFLSFGRVGKPMTSMTPEVAHLVLHAEGVAHGTGDHL